MDQPPPGARHGRRDGAQPGAQPGAQLEPPRRPVLPPRLAPAAPQAPGAADGGGLRGLLRRLRPRRAAPPDLPPGLARALAGNTKVMGAALARQLHAAQAGDPGFATPDRPVPVGLTSRLCRQADLEAPWLRFWCARLGMAPLYHRKVWEEAFVAQAAWEAGAMLPGRRGLGFAVGREPLPALLAGTGAEVLATDLDAADDRARRWHDTHQLAEGAAGLFLPHLVAPEDFAARVAFRAVDMAAIPAELRRGGFDLVWSVCALEHLGSLEAGLDFILSAMACLRPGGVAVHTTEYNLDEEGPTVGRGPTVLYQRRHLADLARRAAALGHEVLAFDLDRGAGPLDRWVDLPPYAEADGSPSVPDAPHLRLLLAGHEVTSVGIILRAGG